MKKLSFEEALNRLEEIIELLNNAEASLDESLELYSESAKLLAFCNKTLETARLNIEEIYPDPPKDYEVEQ